MREISQKLEQNVVRIYLLPGGKMPERKTPGAAAFDVFIRAIVSPYEIDPQKSFLRKTLFDFENIPTYRLEPNESVLLGIGFITEMKFPMLYRIYQRSGFMFNRRYCNYK